MIVPVQIDQRLTLFTIFIFLSLKSVLGALGTTPHNSSSHNKTFTSTSVTNKTFTSTSLTDKAFIKCPCQYEKPNLITDLVICLHHGENFDIDYDPLILQLNQQTLRVEFQNRQNMSASALNGCSVIFQMLFTPNITPFPFDRTRRCPGICLPVPVVHIKVKTDERWLHQFGEYQAEKSVTCSLNAITALNFARSFDSDDDIGKLILTIMAVYRMNECDEHRRVIDSHFTAVRRRLKILILYIGSQSRIGMMIQQQLVVKEEAFDGPNATLAWMASENGFVALCP